ncbi:MAG: aromatic ring-hydroxylating dioxygenase subunit alpha [Novosphingobium sp.]|nr:aromatic ring-hydroxylating dioxygenase subunit alpha [Novosphingobium sp.]MCP5401110.1 aromatic ring-hydroxylating dioxygenase subunit alpha [Novosphingobium sp.]
MNKPAGISTQDWPEPECFGAEAYVSRDYARAEADRLWPKVWQHACRLEEIPEVGDFVTYDIMDDTILIVRSGPEEISAFFNVCAHRGRRLAEGCGRVQEFRCSYHAWKYNLKGECTRVLDRDDWQGRLGEERLTLPKVQADTWGGWVWINMDPEAQPLREYLEPAAGLLDPFELEKMRYRWRLWCHFDCNWKVALEAFIEAYHVEGTHPQLMSVGDFTMWSKAKGLHGHNGFDERDPGKQTEEANTINRPGKGDDARLSIAALQLETWETVNARTTRTMVDAALRLKDELPEGTPTPEVMAHWLRSAREDDAARGVTWPDVSPAQQARAGSSWHVFPNMTIAHSITNALIYRVRPDRQEPERCIFEAAVIERFPEGGEPETEWEYADPGDVEKWRPVLLQDFDNMIQVQRGMRSRGYRGCIPSPKQEQTVANLHRNLARYVGRGGLGPL